LKTFKQLYEGRRDKFDVNFNEVTVWINPSKLDIKAIFSKIKPKSKHEYPQAYKFIRGFFHDYDWYVWSASDAIHMQIAVRYGYTSYDVKHMFMVSEAVVMRHDYDISKFYKYYET